MGTVYEAEHTILDRRIALKIMNPELTEDRKAEARFFQEAKAASAIGHPNIIEIYDIGQDDDGTVFFIMELLQGESLEELLARQERLSTERAVAIILQTLSALHFAHKKGIIHRDLKPANVFLAVDTQGREVVKLLDFGVAKVRDPSGKDKKLTVPGAMMGTPRYASPEQIKGKGEIDQRIDIWAAGVLLYELIAGARPFEGESFSEVLSKILTEKHTPLRETLPGISIELSLIADKAMAKDPNDRYPSAQEMIADLAAFQNAAMDMMSGTAAGVIRSSFPPSSSYGEVPSRASLEETLPTDRGDTAGRDPEREQMVEVSLIPDNVAKKRRPYRILPISLAVILSLGGIGVVIVLLSHSETAEQTTSPSPSKSAPTPSMVTINLIGLPPGAEISLDGEKVSLPIKVDPTDDPAVLKVTARRYRPHIQAISLKESQDIEIEMTRWGVKKAKSRVSKKKP